MRQHKFLDAIKNCKTIKMENKVGSRNKTQQNIMNVKTKEGREREVIEHKILF